VGGLTFQSRKDGCERSDGSGGQEQVAVAWGQWVLSYSTIRRDAEIFGADALTESSEVRHCPAAPLRRFLPCRRLADD